MHVILGLCGLAATLVATRHQMPTSFTGFFHPAAIILLLGAPISILVVAHRLREIGRGLRLLATALAHDARAAEAQMIADLYRFGRELKQGHSVEASKALADAQDPLLREVGPLLLQPGGVTDARETVVTLSYARLARIKAAEEVFRFLARTTPAVGLMGTIIGLVNMLMNLRNFEQLGPAMAVAQLATFYGLILAYGLWAPLARCIETYGRNTSVAARLLERGLASIGDGRSLYDLRLLTGAGGESAGATAEAA